MPIPCYKLYHHPSNCGYTAALYSHERRDGRLVNWHTHTFHEMMYVLEGEAVHECNDIVEPLSAGDLYFIRPDDCHSITKSGRAGNLVYINVEFDSTVWSQFARMIADNRPFPRERRAQVDIDEREECARAFQRILGKYFDAPSKLDLHRFLSTVIGYLAPSTVEDESLRGMPSWLAEACRRMNVPANLQRGLPRMTELSNVSFSHLARTLKAHTGMTPTEYINRRRLRNASMLLTTTSRSISDIADDCGFENLSYFYRRFGREFGESPMKHRMQARRQTIR